MNDHLLINEDWVAIRSSPIQSTKEEFITGSFDIKSNAEKHLIEICYASKDIKKTDVNSQVEYNVSYSVDALTANHLQLKSLFPELDVELPVMPIEPRGIWSYLSSLTVPEGFEESIQNYFVKLQSVIGENVFLQIYFETPSDEEYLENLNELNRIALLEDLHSAKELLDEVRSLRGGSINLLDTLSIYRLEDEAQPNVDLAEAVLYNFERQPFIEYREIAREKYASIQKKLLETNDNTENLDLSKSCLQCQKDLKYHETCLSDLQINYFEKCCASLNICCDLMIEDEVKYADEFKILSGKDRLICKQKELCELSIQLLRLKKKKLIIKRENIKEEVCQLAESEQLQEDLISLENKFYKSQMHIYELQMKILSEEEKLYRKQLKEFCETTSNKITDEPEEEEEEDDYSDALESLENTTILEEKRDIGDDEGAEEEFHDSVEQQEHDSEQIEKQEQENEQIGCRTWETSDVINQFLSTVPLIEETDEVIKDAPKIEEKREKDPEVSNEEYIKKKAIVQLLNRAFRKRAWLRNKQRKFMAEWKGKVGVKKDAEENFKKHHAIHLKREQQKASLESKRDLLQAERRKTVERLKDYRKKHGAEISRPPARYALPVRRTRNEIKTVPFRPGGPSVVVPGSNVSLRMMTDIDVVAKNKQSMIKKSRVNKNKITSKYESINENQSKIQNVKNELNDSAVETVKVIPVNLPPPPLPPPPPPPPPMAPPCPPPLALTTFPIPPKHNISMKKKNIESTNKRSTNSSGFDLQSIVNARLKLKKREVRDEIDNKECLNDSTANLLLNALNKMKKYTSDSTDDEEQDNDSLFD